MEWHARYHRDALDGMRCLSLEERGAYQTILDLLYDYGRPIADDGRWLAGWMGTSVRKWSAIRDALILKGKITVSDGVISNSRAVSEIEKAVKRSRMLRENGEKGGNKSAEKRAKSLELQQPESSPAASEAPSEIAAPLKLVTETVQDTSTLLRARTAAFDAPLWRGRVEQAIELAGEALAQTNPVHRMPTVFRNLCEPLAGEPCDWDLDVLPAIAAASARKARFDKWDYIKPAALENRDRRLAGLPAPQAQPARVNGSGHARRPDTGAVLNRIAAEMGVK